MALLQTNQPTNQQTKLQPPPTPPHSPHPPTPENVKSTIFLRAMEICDKHGCIFLGCVWGVRCYSAGLAGKAAGQRGGDGARRSVSPPRFLFGALETSARFGPHNPRPRPAAQREEGGAHPPRIRRAFAAHRPAWRRARPAPAPRPQSRCTK